MLTRRTFNSLAATALTAPAWAAGSKFQGVMIGAQSYSFRDRSLEHAIAAMKEIGIGYCELSQGHSEPAQLGGKKPTPQELKMWRKTVSLDHFTKIRKQFHKADIVLYAFNYSFRDNFDDEEIARGFEFAKALGVKCITASSNVSTAKRIDKEAKRFRIPVGMHNHSRINDNEFATPESFEKAMAGRSRYIGVNLDIGHFTAANFDPVDYLEKHHDRIVTLHIKDRKRDQGENVPFGQGDTKIKEVLQVLKTKKYPIPAMIEYEYSGPETVSEMKKCFEYCKNALG